VSDPQTIERTVLDIVEELVGELRGSSARPTVTLDASLDRDLGLGSLERVELRLRLEQAFGVLLPDAIMETETPRAIASAVRSAGPSTPAVVLEPPAPPAPGTPSPASLRTLADVLRWQAEVDPGRVHIFLREGDGRERPITYEELRARAAAVAAGLYARGLRRGDAVGLMLRTEEDFFYAFFGTLLAGGVPVPIYPPARLDRLEEYAQRHAGILRNAEARMLITFRQVERVAGALAARVPSLDGVTVVERLAMPGAEAPAIRLVPEDPALVQYTSGSTGEPKGVLLSHANILANIRAIARGIAIGPDDVGVSWLPLYHDMGLIGSWLAALSFGIPIVIVSPLAFLSRPARWLWALHAHRGTLSAAPNFAFELCVRKVSDAEIRGLDLSSWRAAFNGAEPVSPETIERFIRRFAPHGFRAEAMCPVYGLAESSAALTVPPLTRGPWVERVSRGPFERSREARPASPDDPNPLRFVSCGRALPEHEVRIVDAEGRPVRERVEGRVQFRGPSVTAGYVRNAEATRAVLQDGWMDSGDLGYLAGGELFITGRRKDLIIKGGRNLHPQEVEEVVGDTAGIRKGCVAAFGVAEPAIGTERLVVVAESRQTTPEARAQLQAAVVERVVDVLGIPPDTVVISVPGSVRKTSSGKVRRSATREAYLGGQLEIRRSAWRQWAGLLVTDLWVRGRRLADRGRALGYTGYVGVLLLLTLPALWAHVVLLPAGRAVARLVRAWCRLVLRLGGCPLRVEGLENLPSTGPVVLAANHASYIDSIVLSAALPGDFRFVAKRELVTTPLVARVIRKVGHLPVERTDLSRSVADAERVTAVLRRGASLLFFPEGTFLRQAELLPFKLGAFKAAVEARCPVIPIAIRGTREILPAYEWLLRPGPITISIGSPIRPEDGGWKEMVRLRDAARAEIARRL
jgi:1-acyl-sn-glycerol-3-phosphate acyltransferase